MAVITNTLQTPTTKTNREKLSDRVARVYPEDTPIYSDISKEDIDGVHPEWPEQTINAPIDNAQLEGDQFAFDPTLVPNRLGNWTQIFRRTGIISQSQQEADDAGSAVKINRSAIDRGVEIRRDVELSIVSNNASVGGTTRKSAGLASIFTTNVSRGATGANGGFNVGTGLTVAATAGTKRAMTQTLMDDTMQAAMNSGARLRNVYLSLYLKRVFVSFMSNPNVATFRHAVDDGKGNKIISNADIYEGPYGMVKVVPNQVMTQGAGSGAGVLPAVTSNNAIMLDPENISWIWFRPIRRVKDLSNDADASKLVILGEGALKWQSERAHAVVADLFGLTAST